MPTIACLYSEQQPADLCQNNRDGKISPSPPFGPATTEVL
jgi:hypothetical protein